MQVYCLFVLFQKLFLEILPQKGTYIQQQYPPSTINFQDIVYSFRLYDKPLCHTYVTLQKKELCAQLFDLEKCFKICYVYIKRKPNQLGFLFFISSNFEFYLMYALVYVDKFCSISLRQKVECKHLFLPFYTVPTRSIIVPAPYWLIIQS